MAAESHSITRWLAQLQGGDANAGRLLWERFAERMLAAARQRLGGAARRVADEEDVVVVAFERFLAGVRKGRFPRLEDRDDLWAILFTLTQRAALNQVRDLGREKRSGDVHGDSGLMGAADAGLSPDEEAAMRENLARLLAALPDQELRDIAVARMAGYSNAEIAQQVGRSSVTVERRMRLIREVWRRMGAEPGSDFP